MPPALAGSCATAPSPIGSASRAAQGSRALPPPPVASGTSNARRNAVDDRHESAAYALVASKFAAEQSDQQPIPTSGNQMKCGSASNRVMPPTTATSAACWLHGREPRRSTCQPANRGKRATPCWCRPARSARPAPQRQPAIKRRAAKAPPLQRNSPWRRPSDRRRGSRSGGRDGFDGLCVARIVARARGRSEASVRGNAGHGSFLRDGMRQGTLAS